MICQPLIFASCQDDDMPSNIVDNGGDYEAYIPPTEDVIETYLTGDIAIVGSHFDEATSYILSRVRGQQFMLSLNSTSVPETVRVLLIDDENMRNLSADNIEQLIVPAYRQGAIICMHKPSDWKAAGVQMALWQVEHGTDNMESAEEYLPLGRSVFMTRAEDDGIGYDDSSSDLIAIKPGGQHFNLTDIYNPDKTYESVRQITGQTEDGETVTQDSIIIVTPQEPTAYEYGRFAETAVKWMNETKEETATKAKLAGLMTRADTNTNSSDTKMPQICSEMKTINCYFYEEDGDPHQGDWYGTNITTQDYNRNLPLTIRVYTSSAYNFDTDEDYYHLVVEESFDASPLYAGRFERTAWAKEKDIYVCGYTWHSMEIQTRWNKSEYPDYVLRDEWNIQPEGRKEPVVTETVQGWDIGASISAGTDGVSGTLSGKLTFKEGVTETKPDVELTNTKQDDWMVWNYRMGNQAYFTFSLWGGVSGPNVPTNATSRMKSSHQQGWDWVVKDTRRRGDTPFTFDFKISQMKAQEGRLNAKIGDLLVGALHNREVVFDANIGDAATGYKFILPAPHRYKHIYYLTEDTISHETSDLISLFGKVSANFATLYNQLIRTDSEGKIAGRTGVTLESLRRTVGMEWYNLAKELQGKVVADVKYRHKFYVKDEEDRKLKMVKLENGVYKEVGTYLVIEPEGNVHIEEDEVEDSKFDVGVIFTSPVNGYDFTFQVTQKDAECKLLKIPENYTGELEIPDMVHDMKVTTVDMDAWKTMEGVTKLTIPGTFTKVRHFDGLNFEELVIKNGVTKIDLCAFKNCWNLKTVTLPATLKEIVHLAFEYCYGITSITCESTTPPAFAWFYPGESGDMKIFESKVLQNATLYVPKGCREAYRYGVVWPWFKNVVEK